MITPQDIERQQFKKTALGYSTDEVDNFLAELITDYSDVYKDNLDLKEKVAILNEKLNHYKSLEKTIQNVLMMAEKTAEDVKNNAQHEAEEIINAANQKSSSIIQAALQKEQELNFEFLRLKNEFEKVKTKFKLILSAELEFLDTFDL